MQKQKLMKLPYRVSPQMTLLHLRWQQMRLELIQSMISPQSRDDEAFDKKVLATQ